MRIFQDFRGRAIRFTDERLHHVLEHLEMAGMEASISEALLHPQRVVQSTSDANVCLYYRLYQNTMVSEKFLCVVVKTTSNDSFMITAYLTDKVKRGEVLWRA